MTHQQNSLNPFNEDSFDREFTTLISYARSILFQIYITAVTLVLGIIALPILILNADVKRKFCQRWCDVVLFGLRWICGIKSIVNGKEHIPQDGAVIAANHQSMWETMKLFSILPKPVMVLKQELLNIPLFGIWLRASGCIALDRGAATKAMRTLLNDATKAASEGGQIIIFPEGTRLKPGSVERLKPGIAGIYAAANVGCLPVGHNSGQYWEYPGIRKNPGTITMNISPLIEAGQEKRSFLTTLTTKLKSARPDLLPTQSNP